jgi:hypothetical protein
MQRGIQVTTSLPSIENYKSEPKSSARNIAFPFGDDVFPRSNLLPVHMTKVLKPMTATV